MNEYPTLLEPLTRVESRNGLQFFIDYISTLEGAKTKIKNLHWAAKNLPNSDKRGAHLYLDEFLEIVSAFQDTVAECSQGILGEMGPSAISGAPCMCVSPRELIESLTNKTIQFYEGIPSGTIYIGIKSETETFIANLNKYKYLFRLTE